jgi:phosphoadenosine phosphosulfate reductase
MPDLERTEPLHDSATWPVKDLASASAELEGSSAEERIEWALTHLPERHVLSSSFGIQAAVMLHLVTRAMPRIPVVFIDTGYLFPETYRFVDELRERLDLNLRVYRASLSPAWQEARYGRLWEQGLQGLEHYNRLNKVEPMHRALEELKVGTWFTGLRRAQSRSRDSIGVLQLKNAHVKVHPIADWRDRDIHRYLERHHLPYHPLWEQGYVSVGDTHTSRPLEPGMLAEETRFFGLKRECGLHE